jgi:hypothetical protein
LAGNSNSQKGNGIITPTYSLRIEKFQNGFQNQDMELSKQEIELFLPFPIIGSKNFFNKNIPICFNDSKMVFRTGNGII